MNKRTSKNPVVTPTSRPKDSPGTMAEVAEKVEEVLAKGQVDDKIKNNINVEVNEDINTNFNDEGKSDYNVENNIDNNVDNEINANTDTDLKLKSIKDKMKAAKKKESNKQVTVYLTPQNYKRFNALKGKGAKSDLINELLNLYFED